MNEIETWTIAVERNKEDLRHAIKSVEVHEELICYYAMKLETARERQRIDHQLALEGERDYEAQLISDQNG